MVLEAADAAPPRPLTAGCLSVASGTARAALAAAQALVRFLHAHHSHCGCMDLSTFCECHCMSSAVLQPC